MTRAASTLFPGADQPGKTRGGVLPSQRIGALIESGAVGADTAITDDQIQPASLDLRLGEVAYRVRASFLPGERAPVLRKLDAVKMHAMDLTHGAVLERGCVYVAPLQESLHLPKAIGGRANPKSSTGRLDVFTRLITDYGSVFDQVAKGYQGRLYVEIAPRTFSVLARTGDRLNQMRFTRGATSYSGPTLARLDADRSLVYKENAPTPAVIAGGLRIAIDLAGVDGAEIVGYRARRHASIIELGKSNYYNMSEYWEPILKSDSGSIVLDRVLFIYSCRRNKFECRRTTPPRWWPMTPRSASSACTMPVSSIPASATASRVRSRAHGRCSKCALTRCPFCWRMARSSAG